MNLRKKGKKNSPGEVVVISTGFQIKSLWTKKKKVFEDLAIDFKNYINSIYMTSCLQQESCHFQDFAENVFEWK